MRTGCPKEPLSLSDEGGAVLPSPTVTSSPVSRYRGTTYRRISQYLPLVCGGSHGQGSHGSTVSEGRMRHVGQAAHPP